MVFHPDRDRVRISLRATLDPEGGEKDDVTVTSITVVTALDPCNDAARVTAQTPAAGQLVSTTRLMHGDTSASPFIVQL